MAIAPFLPGITAQILVADTPAHEHPNDDEIHVKHPDPAIAAYQAAHTVSNYIKSVTGEPFTVKLALDAPYSDSMDSKVRFYVYLDGILVWISTAARPRVKDNDGHWEEEVAGVKSGKGAGCRMRKFEFAEIKTNCETPEAAKVKRLTQRLLPVGTIEIKVYRENYGKQGGETPGTTKGFRIGNEVFPEKAMKGDAKSHGTTLGAAEKTKRGEVWRTDKRDGEDFPQAIFKFHYRSTEALKQLYIIPRTPDPEVEENSDSNEDEDEDEDDEVEKVLNSGDFAPAQLKALQSLLSKFASASYAKSVGSGGKKRKQTAIKKEYAGKRAGGGRAAKRARNGPAVQIDLTGDDDDEEEEKADDEDEELFVRERRRK